MSRTSQNAASVPRRDAALGKLPTRIVVLADSLALPRGTEPNEEIVYWENTWPIVLGRQFQTHDYAVEIINCGARDRTCESLSGPQFYEHVVLKRPDIVIVQIGIADCAPRIFSRFEKRLLGLPVTPAFFREAIIRRRSAKRAQLTRPRPLAKVHVPPPSFKKALASFASCIADLKMPLPVVFVPIVGYAPQMDLKSPGFSSNVALYNSLLKEFVDGAGLGRLSWAPEREDFWEDGHHLSVTGNRSLANRLFEFLTVQRWVQRAAS